MFWKRMPLSLKSDLVESTIRQRQVRAFHHSYSQTRRAWVYVARLSSQKIHSLCKSSFSNFLFVGVLKTCVKIRAMHISAQRIYQIGVKPVYQIGVKLYTECFTKTIKALKLKTFSWTHRNFDYKKLHIVDERSMDISLVCDQHLAVECARNADFLCVKISRLSG